MEQNLRAGHRRDAVELWMAPVPADDQSADNPVDLEKREFVAAAAVFLFIAPGHVNLGVLVSDLARWVDHMRQVEKPVGGLFQRPGDDPDAVFCRRLARP